jgi:deoxyribonuclease V
MRTRRLHAWAVAPGAAADIQERLRTRVVLTPGRRAARLVAGADLSFAPGSDRVFAGVVVLSWPGLETLAELGREARATFPYVPGLLSFREIPILLPLFRALREPPDLVLCDGQGIAHPRGFGLASHLGLLLDTPTIGCAKSVLVGTHRALAARRGARAPLVVDGRPRGAALRTRAGVRPMIVSPGHMISIDEAVRWTLLLAPRFRVPEPTRRAHTLVNRLRREAAARPAP